MKYIFQNLKLRKLYIFFLFLSLLNIFFSTGISTAKTFSINNVELSTPFKINFDKNKIIDEGFVQAFNQLMLSSVQSEDYHKLKDIKLNQIKSMIETFSIKEEKFVNEIYYIKLNVSFNKKIILLCGPTYFNEIGELKNTKVIKSSKLCNIHKKKLNLKVRNCKCMRGIKSKKIFFTIKKML